MAYRFFLNPTQVNWQEKKASIIDSEQIYKVSNVLRLRENDQVVLLDGNGIIYNAQILSCFSRSIQCRLLSRRTVNTEPNLRITIAQALLKGPKFDYALQKNTEIGVCEFIPITCERTVVQIKEEGIVRELGRRISRYQNIVQSAAEQSERGLIPKVQDILSIDELIKINLSGYDLKLICLERTQSNGIKEVLNSLQDKVQKVLVLIGPEGGFTESEIRTVTSNGFKSVSLGRRIYRSETAGIVISSILFFYFNDL
ncbi:MAG: 16S rRNA (uracil(1498)-N(3))-methyltransferase [Candidatus Melainabacteria bacterium]|nr:16S rRNA (uracil(1498)-N(3))-methyltransferase [Candidatus Melainabacteria bacterium]